MDRSFKTGSRTAPRLALAITTAIAGLTLAGMAANAAPRAEVSFANAQTALSKGQINKAIQHAEAAVLADPRNPGYRALLGAAYMEAGRFNSAATSFGDSLDLGDDNPRTVLSFALAKIALGDSRSAVEVLDEYAQAIDPADMGLALALAGQPERGVHVLVEKPIAATVVDAQRMIDAAKANSRVLMVGQVERFNPAVEAVKRAIDGDDVISIQITRVGPFPPRMGEVGVVIDLAVHDIDIIRHLTDSEIVEVQPQLARTKAEREDTALLQFRLDSGVIAHITTNWVTPYKTMFQIQNFNVVLWTSIVLVIVLISTIYMKIDMPMEADTLLFGESAKMMAE